MRHYRLARRSPTLGRLGWLWNIASGVTVRRAAGPGVRGCRRRAAGSDLFKVRAPCLLGVPCVRVLSNLARDGWMGRARSVDSDQGLRAAMAALRRNRGRGSSRPCASATWTDAGVCNVSSTGRLPPDMKTDF
ncbi:hypothetical protein AAFF_G00039600 [Aldrovandia affinis]|uniref:Uncharacterized protein n=1 Tax=Aldrovandia affinis TaxID=143900 RepID=A0AAD7WGD8_9TELE|nr:hypothetical protein AAFF_G00039600 [Aldrovandia affinis]